MRYRARDANGDYTFGQGSQNFLINSAECVGQAVLTRLALWQGEWFLDVTDGTPWLQDVLGYGTEALFDQAIRDRITGTEGVTGIVDYSSVFDRSTRALTINATIQTAYGAVTLSTTLALNQLPPGYGPGAWGNAPFGE